MAAGAGEAAVAAGAGVAGAARRRRRARDAARGHDLGRRRLELGEIEKAADTDRGQADHRDRDRPHPVRLRRALRLGRLLDLRRRVGAVLAAHRHHVGVHRRRDVLHLLRADIGELHRQLVGDLLMHRARDADAADFGEALQPGCDVDAIAQEVAVALDHVADRDADAKGHLPAGRIGHVAGAQALLDIDRAAHGFDRARKFGEHGVASGIENAAAALGDEIVGHLTVGRQPTQRLLFVLGNQSGVAGNIGRKNRRDLAFHEKQPRTTPASGTMPPEVPRRNLSVSIEARPRIRAGVAAGRREEAVKTKAPVTG